MEIANDHGPANYQTPVNERFTMKAMTPRLMMFLGAAILGLASSNPALADETKAATRERTFGGTVSAVDQKERTVTVKGTFGKRVFNAGDNCIVSFSGKPDASLTDLRPGHKVEVSYRNAQGVPVAHRIAQEDVAFKGHISAIDPANRTLSVRDWRVTRNFTIGENCNVVLRNDKTGALGDLKIGHTVSVIYETPEGALVVQRIEQKSETFVGTIRAIDAGARTVKARSLMGERKFNLADGCRIVVEGKAEAGLGDLRIGDRVTFSYENTDGVLVADRLGRENETDTSQTAKATSHPQTQ